MEQDKSLDMALAQIERQFGKGAVMKLNGAAVQQIKAIPTGALALDLALGIGGLPRGRVVEIFGPESSGKCLTAETLLWSDVGLETVGELFARLGQTAERASRVTDVVDQGVRVVNERGELELVVALTHNNLRPVVEITAASGRSVKVTGNHPLRVLDRDGSLVWREARDITVGDTLVSAAFGAEEAGGGGDLAEDEAVLLGYLATWFSPDGEPEIVPEVSEILAGPMGVEVEPGAAEYLLPDAATRVMLAEAYGLHLDAIDPGVPHCVRVAGAKAQRAFLSALIDGGGGVDAAGTVSFETYAEAMARQVQLMLYGFGIPAGLSSESDESAAGHRWKVTIDPAVTTRFLVEIGFRSQRRHARAAGARPVAGDSHLAVADVEDLAGRRYTCEPVTAVRDAGYEPTFDIVVPASHSFVANGILSHNTTLALHVVAEAQRNGGVAAFIDAEHALDPSYAKALGVDIDELYISQPDTGEQALEIADMLIRSGALDVVVIDSVAALVPRAELEGDMGDTHVGLQARLMSQALRKLAGTINRSETTAVFINQLREKIGVMFGSPETTPGGRALKFYSSVRIDVRRIESIKQGTESVGNRVRAKIVKNKVAPPFRVAEFDIMFGSGISREGSLIDVAVEHGIVKKSGAWYTFDGDQLGQGREKAKEFLRDNAEIAVQLQDRVLRTVGVVAAESSDDEPTADDNPADRESLDVDD